MELLPKNTNKKRVVEALAFSKSSTDLGCGRSPLWYLTGTLHQEKN
jgi:hypothetical protein